jgi:pSer/pThr/pTyr-binding forkhead associated (FHA) protein
MSNPVRISWSGGDRTFPDGTPISIGRDPTSTIRLSDERVSRRHAELRPTADGWMLVDLGSTSGTFIGGQQVQDLLLRTATTVRFGGMNSADDVMFDPSVAPSTFPAPGAHHGPTELASPVVFDATVLPAGAPSRPGGVLAPNAAAGATEVAGDTLHVQFGSGSTTLHPGQVLHLGRGTPELSTTNPTVSRNHVRIQHTADGWSVEDLNSSRGTFLDGRRIQRQVVRGSMAFVVGPPDSGERLVVVAAGATETSFAKRLRNPRLLSLISVGAIAIALVALVGVFVLRDEAPPATASAAQLRAATVLIVSGDRSGSGTIIDGDRGLILTNAHVARPDAPGQVLLYGEGDGGLPESDKEVEIYLSGGDDETATPTYLGKVVAADGYLDFAVVQLTKNITGSLLDLSEPLGLPDIPIGNSNVLSQGDAIQMLGYPAGVSGSLAPQIDAAIVSGFALDDRIGDNRAWINSSINISAGNSGGLAADRDGRLIGVPSAERGLDGDSVARLRPIHLALPLIDAARDGTPYTSPYVTPATDEQMTLTNFATPGAPFSTSCRNRSAAGPGTASSLGLMFEYEQFPEGHQDVHVFVLDGDLKVLGDVTSADSWPVEWNVDGCAVVTVPLSRPLATGTDITVVMFVGPNEELTLDPFTVSV